MNKSNEVIGVSDKKSENHSCCGESGHQHNVDSNVITGRRYKCPMKCEGDKTYNVSGVCPVCNMHLSLVK